MRIRYNLMTLLICTAFCQNLWAYSGYNACQRFSGLSDEQHSSYQYSPFCIPVVNLTHTPLSVSVNTPNKGSQKKVVVEGNVIVFTGHAPIKRGASFPIRVTTKNNKVIYDSSKHDQRAINLYGLMCMRSLNPKEADKTIYVKPKKAKFGPLKCIPWIAIRPMKGPAPA